MEDGKMMLIDFNKYRKKFKTYDGAMKKYSVEINCILYMLKFADRIRQKKNELNTSYVNIPSSEYISCHIFESIGIPTQKTLLGFLDDRMVVACKDFMQNLDNNIYQLQEFKTIKNTVLTTSDSSPKKLCELKEIYEIINHNKVLDKIDTSAIERFWDTFVIDTLILNSDRHVGNWGYIVNLNTGDVVNAPVYDCGSSLLALYSDEKINEIFNSNNLINNLLINYPNANFVVNNEKMKYRDFLNLHYDKNCDEALIRIVPRIDMNKIKDIINETYNIGGISKKRCEFLKEALEIRYEQILIPAYKKALKLQREQEPNIMKNEIKPKVRAKSR